MPAGHVQVQTSPSNQRGGAANGGTYQLDATSPRSTTMTMMTKLEFPRFNGTNLRAWMCKVEHFFSFDGVECTQRVKVASIDFDDIAID